MEALAVNGTRNHWPCQNKDARQLHLLRERKRAWSWTEKNMVALQRRGETVNSLRELPGDWDFPHAGGRKFLECRKGKIDGVTVGAVGALADDGSSDSLLVAGVSDRDLLATVGRGEETLVNFDNNVSVFVNLSTCARLAVLVIPRGEATANSAGWGRGSGSGLYVGRLITVIGLDGNAFRREGGLGLGLEQRVATFVKEGCAVLILAIER